MSLTRNYIAVDFSLAQGQFQGANGATGNSYTAQSLRMSARITTPGGYDVGNLQLAIYGMTLSHMNALTVLPTGATAVGQNTVVVRAGNTPNPQTIVFTGTVSFAFADATSPPNTCFRVNATGGHVEKVMPATPTSVQGTGDVATIMGQLAQTMGRSLENSGVNVKLQNIYLPGSPLQQVDALARAAGIMWTLEGDKLAIFPAGQPRQGGAITVSKDTGMVASPAFVASGIVVTTLFQGPLKFGCQINVQSILQPACGAWFVKYMEHALDCMIPNGAWFTTMEASKIGVGDNG